MAYATIIPAINQWVLLAQSFGIKISNMETIEKKIKYLPGLPYCPFSEKKPVKFF
jgi:hypothetical protein